MPRGQYFRRQLRTFYDYQPEPEERGAGTTPALPADEQTEEPPDEHTGQDKPT